MTNQTETSSSRPDRGGLGAGGRAAVFFAAVVFLVGELAAFPSFFLAAAFLHSRTPITLSEPDVLRAVAFAHRVPVGLLSPWRGFGVFCLWTAVLLAAAYLLKCRDA